MGNRYVEVTHTYILEVPEAWVDESLDTTVNMGVSMMERVMGEHARGIHNIKSDWKLMPKEYSLTFPTTVEGLKDIVELSDPPLLSREGIMALHERELDRRESLAAIEADADPGVSFTGDAMGQRPKVTHPWDQHLRITPLDHPMALAETVALNQEGLLCGAINPDDLGLICWGVKGHAEGEHIWGSAARIIPATPGEITDGS